jgi:DtxR family Mn-dependent transcriptional regulator
MTDEPVKKVAELGTEKSLFEDEALELVWEIGEKGVVVVSEVVKVLGKEENIRRMQDDGLIRIDDEAVEFTEAGRLRARDIIRRHRLAERLFFDVLDMQDYEADACRLEHALSPESEEALCTLLGHPPRCPHGKPIPKGNCCALYTRKVKPLVQGLRDAKVGSTVKVLFINVPSLDRLAAMGLVPGAEIRLHQKKPSYVLGIEETTIAIDEDIAKGIFVKPL